MKTHQYFIPGTALAVLFATPFLFNAGPVRAQTAGNGESDTMLREIVVTARPQVLRTVTKTDAAGRVMETLTLERHVSYTDLDLSRPGDVLELKQRIKVNAKEACEEIENMYPLLNWDSEDTTQGCINRAVDSANKSLDAAIAAAQ